jgi:hypothetical protein
MARTKGASMGSGKGVSASCARGDMRCSENVRSTSGYVRLRLAVYGLHKGCHHGQQLDSAD